MSQWEAEFRHRMERFHRGRGDGLGISIKLRVTSGCFHRDHSPEAYRIIDGFLASHPSEDCLFEEHESGPELLVYMAVATAGITFAKSVVDLVTTIVKARSEGIRKGDSPSAPLVLIVRGIGVDEEFHEDEVLRIDSHDPPSEKMIEDGLTDAINRIAEERVRRGDN